MFKNSEREDLRTQINIGEDTNFLRAQKLLRIRYSKVGCLHLSAERRKHVGTLL